MKVITNTTKTTTATKTILIAGKFKPNSIDGKLFTVLADGKPHPLSEILRKVKPQSAKNLELRAIVTIRRYAKNIGAFDLVRKGQTFTAVPFKKAA